MVPSENQYRLMKPVKQLSALVVPLLLLSCHKQHTFDASGSFEAEETIISAEASGVIKSFTVEEGQVLQAGQVVGYIDSSQLYLKKLQLEAQAGAVTSRKPDIPAQLASLQAQLQAAEKEQRRFANLVRAGAV